MLRDVSVHNTKLVIDFLNSHEELFTREAARYATEKMNPRDKSQVKLFDKAVQRRGRSANRKETEQDAKEATEESSLVESEESGKSAKKNANGTLVEEDTEVTLGSVAAYSEEQTVDYTTAKSVFDRSATISASEKGLVPLTITTQDVSDAATVEYSSSLTLTIEPVETT